MAKITVDGTPFYILPETASWSYSMKIQSFDTYNGRVVQLLACNVDSLTVEGYIPNHRIRNSNPSDISGKNKPRNPLGDFIFDQWAAMEEFEANVKRIMAAHERGGRAQSATGKSVPANFVFSEVGWNGKVYLVGYSDVRYEPDIPAVKYTLKFQIDSGFSKITQAAYDQGLKNIPDGVGWVRSVYNTPNMDSDSWEKFKDALAKYVDDAGTFDASTPADWYAYLTDAWNESDDDSSASDNADKDSDYTSKRPTNTSSLMTNITSKGMNTVDDVLAQYGLVKSSGGAKF